MDDPIEAALPQAEQHTAPQPLLLHEQVLLAFHHLAEQDERVSPEGAAIMRKLCAGSAVPARSDILAAITSAHVTDAKTD